MYLSYKISPKIIRKFLLSLKKKKTMYYSYWISLKHKNELSFKLKMKQKSDVPSATTRSTCCSARLPSATCWVWTPQGRSSSPRMCCPESMATSVCSVGVLGCFFLFLFSFVIISIVIIIIVIVLIVITLYGGISIYEFLAVFFLSFNFS